MRLQRGALAIVSARLSVPSSLVTKGIQSLYDTRCESTSSHTTHTSYTPASWGRAKGNMYETDPKSIMHPLSGKFVVANYVEFVGAFGGAENDSLRGFGSTSQAFRYMSEDGTTFVKYYNGGTDTATTPDGQRWAWKKGGTNSSPLKYTIENFPHDKGMWVKE